jgi:hypothetical protein
LIVIVSLTIIFVSAGEAQIHRKCIDRVLGSSKCDGAVKSAAFDRAIRSVERIETVVVSIS